MQNLELLPVGNPLRERFGSEFLNEVPDVPGLYAFFDQGGGVLYVGKSIRLRRRLGSYFALRPLNISRKMTRLLYKVQHIEWRPCSSQKQALVLENQILRELKKPNFSVTNTHPEQYHFLVLHRLGFRSTLEISLAAPKVEGDGIGYGCFKNLKRTRQMLSALRRLFWWSQSLQNQSGALATEELLPPWLKVDWESPCLIEWSRAGDIRWDGEVLILPLPQWNSLVGFLRGSSAQMIEDFEASLFPAFASLDGFLKPLVVQDLDILRTFFVLGPQLNYQLIEQARRSAPLILQEELDDLMVVYGKSRQRSRTQDTRDHSSGHAPSASSNSSSSSRGP